MCVCVSGGRVEGGGGGRGESKEVRIAEILI